MLFGNLLICAVSTVSAFAVLEERDGPADFSQLAAVDANVTSLTKKFKNFDGTQAGALKLTSPLGALIDSLDAETKMLDAESPDALCGYNGVFTQFLDGRLQPDVTKLSNAIVAARKRWPEGLTNVAAQEFQKVKDGFDDMLNEFKQHACKKAERQSFAANQKSIDADLNRAINAYRGPE